MPGLFGIVHRGPTSSLPSEFERLLPSVASANRMRQETLQDSSHCWMIGRRHLGVLQPEPQLKPGAPLQALFHGDLHNASDLCREFAVEHGDGAGLLCELYARKGIAIADRFEGAFCAALLDGSGRQLHLISDPLGSYPLYWTVNETGLVFGSELRAVLRTGLVPRELDHEAVADFLTFGFQFGAKTLARHVKLLPPGSVLTYEMATGEVQLKQVWDLGGWFNPWSGDNTSFFRELADRFSASVDRSFSGDHQFGLSLSGGLDSRVILSTVNGRASSLTTYTLGVEGCADQVIAERLSSLTGTKHCFFGLDDAYLTDFLSNLARMVSLTDGMYLSHGLTEMLALDFLGQTGIEVLLRGHGGELAKTDLAWPLHTDPQIDGMQSSRDLVPYLLDRLDHVSSESDQARLFTPDWVTLIAESPRASLEGSLRSVNLSPADACGYLYLMEHHRRFTISSLELFRHQVEVRLPFVDNDFLRCLFRAPADWRRSVDTHRSLMSAHNRALLQVRNSNTGAPANASPLVEMVFDKINTALKRLNVRGYRHYHNLDTWMRARLAESVESVLLDRAALDRGIVTERGLRSILSDTRNGVADHSLLLQALLIVELWQRENL